MRRRLQQPSRDPTTACRPTLGARRGLHPEAAIAAMALGMEALHVSQQRAIGACLDVFQALHLIRVSAWAPSRRGASAGSWLERMLTRKPGMLVMVASANRMARIFWAMTLRSEVCRDPVAAA